MSRSIKIQRTEIVDLDVIVSIERKQENVQFILPNSKDEHTAIISDENLLHLTIKSTANEIVGFVILSGVQDNNESIEFRRIVIDVKGRGYGRESIREIKKMCFEELTCHRLWLDVLEENTRARHLYKSEGFVEEGKLRDCLKINGVFKSLIVMSILQFEYK